MRSILVNGKFDHRLLIDAFVIFPKLHKHFSEFFSVVAISELPQCSSQFYRSFLQILLKSLRFLITHQTIASSSSRQILGSITKVTSKFLITLPQFPQNLTQILSWDVPSVEQTSPPYCRSKNRLSLMFAPKIFRSPFKTTKPSPRHFLSTTNSPSYY